MFKFLKKIINNSRYTVLLIILLASFLRFFQLNINPPSLTWDEAAWGYNAYSLGIDGKDEFGRFLPIDYLESFGDFKPPLYAYLSVLPVKLFGLTEFSTRFASAFFGVLTVLVTYLLTKELFDQNSKMETRNSKQIENSNNKQFKNSLEIGNWKLKIPIIAAALLAISPWHILLSRAAFEANVATFFIVTGVLLFLKGLKKGLFLPLSIFSFCLSIYTFNSARIVAPLLILLLSFVHLRALWNKKKALIQSIIVGIIMIAPILSFLLSPQASLRFKEVNIFSDIEIIKIANQEIANDNNAWWSKIIHNRRVAYFREATLHYFDNFNPDFLFIKGDRNPKFSTGDTGIMYLWELPFLIAGVIFLIRRREKSAFIIYSWLLIGIIPASLARETPHALRIEGSIPTLQILVAYGLVEFIEKLKESKGFFGRHKRIFAISTIGLVLISIVSFLHGYFLHYPRETSSEWQYGYKEAVEYVDSAKDKYSSVNVGSTLGRPYIYFLFYTKYDPEKFRTEAKVRRDVFGFVHVESFDKYKFFDNDLDAEGKDKSILLVDAPKDLYKKIEIKKSFNLLNGQSSIIAFEYE